MNGERKTLGILGPALLALTMGSAIADAQVTEPVPLAYGRAQQLTPEALVQLRSYPAAPVAQVPAGVVVGPWQSVTPVPTGNSFPANPLLMTDGTVIVHINFINPNVNLFEGTRNWLQLIPDINGNYATGTWSTFATLPAGYAPIFCLASQILNDGRVIINGGEYNDNDNNGDAVRTTKGAKCYYPSFGAWLNVAPPRRMVNDRRRAGKRQF